MNKEVELLVEDLTNEIKALKWHILRLEGKIGQIKLYANKTEQKFLIPEECQTCY